MRLPFCTRFRAQLSHNGRTTRGAYNGRLWNPCCSTYWPACATDADALAPVEVERLVRAHNRGIKDNARHLAKKRILPFYLHIRETQPERWASWQVDDASSGASSRRFA